MKMSQVLVVGLIYGLVALTLAPELVSANGCPFARFSSRRSLSRSASTPNAAPAALSPVPIGAPVPAPAPHGDDVYGQGPLNYDFYATTCPTFQTIVQQQVAAAIAADPLSPAELLRLFFHDCFVHGCDASVLLKSTYANLAERDASDNVTLGKFSVIDAIKAELEAACPGTVSCADILAAAAAEAVLQAGGPQINLAYGRRDGLDSFAAEAQTNLPASTLLVGGLIENFANVGLNLTDVVVLSGGHTIGQARCSTFANRFGNASTDPFEDVAFGQALESYCLAGDQVGLDRKMSLDVMTTTTFDNGYYQSLLLGRGVLTTDDVLRSDPRTSALVSLFASDQAAFFAAFQVSMAKMGRITTLTGTMGQIRSQCWVRNTLDTTADPQANLDFDPVSTDFCIPASCPTTPVCTNYTTLSA